MIERFEGTGGSQLRQAISKFGRNDFDKFELATVLAPPPEIRIKLDDVSQEFDHTDVIVAEHLTRHKRVVTIEHEELAERDLGDGIGIDMLDTDDGSPDPVITYFKESYVLLTFEDVLKPGDRVIVASMNDGQTYVILDRVVQYGAESV